jgi:hypothetical protein
VSQASVASLVGIFVFQGALSGWTYRSLFVITTVLQADIKEKIEIQICINELFSLTPCCRQISNRVSNY